MQDQLLILGNGDSSGVPRPYCDCPVCTEARSSGRNRRWRSAAQLMAGERQVLIDCGPDIGAQLERFGIRAVDEALITHAHYDHIGGLPVWADMCRWTNRKGVLYSPEPVLATIRRQYPWLESSLSLCAGDKGIAIGPYRISPWLVNHGKNGVSYSYLFERDDDGFRMMYASDCIGLSEQELQPFFGLDVLVLGTSFVREPYPYETRSVYDMEEGLELVKRIQPGRTWFTHMSHDVNVDQLGMKLPDGVQLAEAGTRIPLVRA